MKKKLIVLALLPILAIASCGSFPIFSKAPLSTIPPYTPPTPPEQAKNIESINILGIPEDYKIGMGLFNEANIRCEITYTDSTTYTFQLLEETLPYELRVMLGQEGEHNVTLQIRNKTVTFKIIMVDEGIRYVVRFLNYNDDVLYQTKVMPNNKVQYFGDEPSRMSDITYKYIFDGWDQNLDTYLVDHSVDIHTVYKPTFKINDYLPIEQGAQFVSEYKGKVAVSEFERYYVSYYVGRITHFPIARDRSGYVTHTQGNKEVFNYLFYDVDSPINPDPASPTYDYHQDISLSLPSIVSKSYKYEDPAGSIDPKYIPAGPQLINFDFITGADVPFELHSIRSRNSEGKTYNTVVSNYVDVITDYLSTDKTGTLHIPEDFPNGDYTATIFMDIDVYAYVYAENRGGSMGIINSPIFEIACPAEIYVGLNIKENEMVYPNYNTSTYDDDVMKVDIFAEMMKHARSAYEE